MRERITKAWRHYQSEATYNFICRFIGHRNIRKPLENIHGMRAVDITCSQCHCGVVVLFEPNAD